MKVTLGNAANPLALYRKVFEEHVTAPMLASQKSMRAENALWERALISAQRA